MKRRSFIKTAAVGSACSLADITFAGSTAVAQTKLENKCKITVLKRTLNGEWNKEFRNGQMTLCNRFQDGQEFNIDSPWTKPEGFCEWAWADIRTYIHLVETGKFETFVCCCTDGFRPVFFKIERIKS
jgi:uncharacterized repeat protein (TIGR04076 family)